MEREKAEEILDMAWHLEEMENVRELTTKLN